MARIYLFDSYRLDVREHLLSEGGRQVTLTPKAASTLMTLLDRPNEVVEKEELMARVWGGAYVEEGVVAQNVYLLRRALGEDGRDLIATIPNRGYRFNGEVRKVSAGVDRIRELAVLPFRCLGFGDEGEVLGLAMADAVSTELGGQRELAVRPTATVRSLLSRGNDDPLAAGRTLRVDAVVTGTLHQVGGRLRATVQLLTLGCESPTWAERFEAAAGDLFALQDAVAGALADGLIGTDRQRRRHAPDSPEAYLHYSRGRYFWNKRTALGLEKAIAAFQRAIEAEPRYALAHAGLADCYALQPLYAGVPPREAFPRAASAALEALAIDHVLAPALTSLAYSRFIYHWDWLTARRDFERALRIDPNYPTAHHWLGFLCSAMGRHEDAISSARRAVELDPLSLIMNSDLGMVLYSAGRTSEAVERFERTLDLDSSFAYAHFGAALARTEQDDLEAAEASARRALELETCNPAMAGILGFVLARAGKSQEARQQLARLEEGHGTAAPRALVLTALGETAPALDALIEAAKERSPFTVFLAVWPAWEPLRGERRFACLLFRLGRYSVPQDSAHA